MRNIFRGQVSTEFLILLAITLFVLAVGIVITNEQIGDISKIKEQNDAKNTVMDISTAANEVYAQGEGAKKQIYIMIPSSYDPSASYIENNTIRLNIRGTDYASIEDFEVHGSLPGTSGAHWIWVVSEGNRVRIGDVMISTSRNSIYLLVDRNSSASTSFSVECIWNSSITVTPTTTWTAGDVTIETNPTLGFDLDPDDSQVIMLTSTANGNAVGYYSGNIKLNVHDDYGHNETITIPVTVEVVRYEVTVAEPALSVTPEFWGETLSIGETADELFTVCTNSETEVTSVIIAPSTGEPGDWVGNTSNVGPILQDSCETKLLSITVPNGTAADSYYGSIHFTGQGAENAEDTISIYVSVPAESGSCEIGEGNLTCNCYVGLDYLSVPTCNCEPATVYVLNGIIYGGPDNGQTYAGTLRGGSGIDIIAGTIDADIIYGGTSDDKICGLEGDDTIYGENGNDIIDGGSGDDVIDGGGGGDHIYGKEGNDNIIGGQGNDEVDGGSGDDIISGDDGTDIIYGGTGNDIITGGASNDMVCGNAGGDIINGDDGSDELDGGTDIDTIDGGIQGDTCYRGETLTSCEWQTTEALYWCGPS
ncbi:MAG: calcium-binding protein [Candidatus Micrarchaeota archaeon]